MSDFLRFLFPLKVKNVFRVSGKIFDRFARYGIHLRKRIPDERELERNSLLISSKLGVVMTNWSSDINYTG